MFEGKSYALFLTISHSLNVSSNKSQDGILHWSTFEAKTNLMSSFVGIESAKSNMFNADSQLKSESLHIYLDLMSRNGMMLSEK